MKVADPRKRATSVMNSPNNKGLLTGNVLNHRKGFILTKILPADMAFRRTTGDGVKETLLRDFLEFLMPSWTGN